MMGRYCRFTLMLMAAQKRVLYQRDAVIWQMIPDEASHTLLLELRSDQRRQTWFAAIDLWDGRICWDDLRLPETWWAGLGGVSAGSTCYILRYPDPQIPAPSGFYAIDIRTGRLRWQRQEGILAGAWPGMVEVLEADDRLVRLSAQDGQPTATAAKPAPASRWLAPVHYPAGHAATETLARLITRLTGRTPAPAPIEYLEVSGLIVLAWHAPHPEGLHPWLLITDGQGQIQLHQALHPPSKGAGLNMFGVYEDSIWFVEDKKLLCHWKIGAAAHSSDRLC